MKRSILNSLLDGVQIIPVFTEEEREIHRLGLIVFSNKPQPVEIYTYTNQRFCFILQQLNDQSSDDDPFIILKATIYSRGAINHSSICRVQEMKALIQQNNHTPISSTIISMVCEKLNIYSYKVSDLSPDIFCMDFDNVSLILRQSEVEIKNNQFIDQNKRTNRSPRGLIELRVKCSQIIMFPIILFNHFMLIVMLPRSKSIYVLASTILNAINFNELLKKLVAYFNTINEKSARKFEEWTIYIDGQDANKHRLNQDYLTYSNCGIFIICYMLNIGLHKNIKDVIALFESHDYQSLFVDINVENILFKKKSIAVFLNDFEHFL